MAISVLCSSVERKVASYLLPSLCLPPPSLPLLSLLFYFLSPSISLSPSGTQTGCPPKIVGCSPSQFKCKYQLEPSKGVLLSLGIGHVKITYQQPWTTREGILRRVQWRFLTGGVFPERHMGSTTCLSKCTCV